MMIRLSGSIVSRHCTDYRRAFGICIMPMKRIAARAYREMEGLAGGTAWAGDEP